MGAQAFFNIPYGPTESEDHLDVGGIQMDRLTHYVCINGQSIHLRYKEFKILWLLLKYRGAVVRMNEMKAYVWGDEWSVSDELVFSYVSQVKEKLGRSSGTLIQTLSGIGFRVGIRPSPLPASFPVQELS